MFSHSHPCYSIPIPWRHNVPSHFRRSSALYSWNCIHAWYRVVRMWIWGTIRTMIEGFLHFLCHFYFENRIHGFGDRNHLNDRHSVSLSVFGTSPKDLHGEFPTTTLFHPYRQPHTHTHPADVVICIDLTSCFSKWPFERKLRLLFRLGFGRNMQTRRFCNGKEDTGKMRLST